LWISGCALTRAQRQPLAQPPQRVALEAVHLRAGPDALTGLDGYSAGDLFDLGLRALKVGDPGRARALYARLLDEFPDSEEWLPAQHNLALACQEQGDYPCAVQHYDGYLEQAEGLEVAEEGELRLRLAELLEELGRFGRAEVQAAKAYEQSADLLLFDAKPPADAKLPGGNGIPFDWSALRGFNTTNGYMLSGGLDPQTVAGALKATCAPMVDVSSGVEKSPGVKDLDKIRLFVERAKTAACK
jgi:tetratricopeptide (TPR) repeat protein